MAGKYTVGTPGKSWREGEALQVTFIVTADCNLRCKYCYITHKKSGKVMDLEVAKKFIDYLLSNQELKKQNAIVLDFIGGEPLLEVELIDRICDYFKVKAYSLNDKWYWNYRINICTNGVNYSDKRVQEFIKKNEGKINISITLDGTKEKHDMQRVFPNGKGSYDVIKSNIGLWLQQFPGNTKVTFASDDLKYLKESIIQLWNDGIHDVSANVVFEDVWKEGDDDIFESQLKELADYIIDNELYDKYRCTLFNDFIGGSYNKDDLLKTSCGAGKMLALGPTGDIYPCMRYYGYSLNNKEEWTIGNVDTGIDLEKVRPFETAMYKYQSDQECLSCEVATGCSFCQGFNYDEADTATIFQRAKYICKMHKARVRANNYYFAKLYNLKGIRRQVDVNQRKKLIFLLDDNYSSFCSYDNKKTGNKMSKEMISLGLRFAQKNFMRPIFLHSDTFRDMGDIKELCEHEALHVIPVSDNLKEDMVKDCLLVFNKDTLQCSAFGQKNIIFNLQKEDVENLPYYMEVLFEKVNRINLNILDLDRTFDLKKYSIALDQVTELLIDMANKSNSLKELNVLTDILYSNEHSGCKAGTDEITYAPDGKLYICPAFYSEGMEAVGDVEQGIKIGNRHLLGDEYAPLCNVCDANQCENCKFVNLRNTNEVNVPPSFQCRKSHIEREHSLRLQKSLGKKWSFENQLNDIDYDDPLEILAVSGKNLGFYDFKGGIK